MHGVSRLTDEHARAVGVVVNGERMDYYKGRFEEVCNSDALRIAATAVADAYKIAGQYDKDGVFAIIDLALGEETPDRKARRERVRSLIGELIDLGYIWEPAGQLFMEAGIPSLMDYIAGRRPDEQPQLPAVDARRISDSSRKRQGATAA